MTKVITVMASPAIQMQAQYSLSIALQYDSFIS
jgi:hypothetical protein